jgi:choline dehydrogenase-like flavoprotein
MLRGPFSRRELRVIEALCDAFLPSAESEWRRGTGGRVAAALGALPERNRRRLRRLLRLLRSPIGGLVLAGRPAAFRTLGRDDRQAYLRALSHHRLARVRGGFEALKRLVTAAYYADSDDRGCNPTWPAIGYPGPLNPCPDVPKPIEPLRVRADTVLDCDVVIVGSGAGGGVVAGELASAGYDVVVLEKGEYVAERDFDQRELGMLRKTYLDSGLLATADLGVSIFAGSCLGGGTVVNYTTSFRTPDHVRDEWHCASGVDLFVDAELTRALDAVCAGFDVNRDHNRPSSRDAIMGRGLEALGWHVDRMPRNVVGCAQDDICGYCGFGCVRGAKRSTTTTYLQRAADRGARLVTGCSALKVVAERGRAVGVLARSKDGHELRVRARVVVAAAGAIHTPALLLRSGLRASVGENLRLHPVTAVWGYFDEEVRPWTGTLQALYSDELGDLDAGYGVKFETAPLHPAFSALGVAWRSADQFDDHMRRLAHASFVGFLTRDRYGGRVSVDSVGEPVVDYRVARYDQRHVRRGVEGAARVLQAAGANAIFSSGVRSVGFRPGRGGSVTDWLSRVHRVGYGSNQTLYFSFHQMGTCRMGRSPDDSVVDGNGESHAIRNLFVADASLFPGAVGVNPMITIAALAYCVAQRVKARL